MSGELIPATVRRLTPQQREAGEVWISERKRNYPTMQNRQEREDARRRLRDSGAYTSPPEANRFKRGYTQRMVDHGRRSQIILVEKPPSLMDRLLYASIHSTDSLVLEMLTFIRDSNWLEDK
ncbi:Hypothetical protein GLP15_3065 [Giardia lamblia P15]|uniref:Uncharacterized protein n=1 Tax=Giardia intestinalis (strain P15) TaxID=658858 RepID=E1F942_GIAIA|nr:Hypothetical protein GLP15_3065 [Giardia lamblia P15]